MGGFDNAKMVKINNKEVASIKTNSGGIIYQKPTSIVVTGNSITLGYRTAQWLKSVGDVVINWGDGSYDTVNNPTTSLSHIYTDGEQSHSIVFLGTVTSLGEYCFWSCTGLTSVVIPSSVTSLGYACFWDCTGLTSVVIPNSVTSLGYACFYRCTGLTSITIPNSVTSLEKFCFMDCNSLIDYQLYWTGNNIITYNSNKMINNTNTVFTIPNGETANYIAKGYPSDKLVERS